MMNDMEFKINYLKSRMKRNSSMSPKIKAFISVCVRELDIFSEYLDKLINGRIP